MLTGEVTVLRQLVGADSRGFRSLGNRFRWHYAHMVVEMSGIVYGISPKKTGHPDTIWG